MDMKSITGLAIAVVVIGLVLGIGFLILIEFEEELGTDTLTVSNETLTAVANSSYSYPVNNHTTANLWCYNNFAPVTVTNATDGVVINSANYTFVAHTGGIQAVGGSEFTDFNWNVTYSYNFGNNSQACAGIGETINATAEIPTWLAIVVIIFIVGIILFLVFSTLPRLSGEGGSFGMGGSSGDEGTVASY
jgi:hypothetical protein